MEKLINRLPTEIVDLILEYQGYHTWRNGKYICRLQLDDKYDAVKRRPIINLKKGLVNPSNNKFNVSFTKINQGTLYRYDIYTAIYSDKIHWYMMIQRYYSRHQYKKNKNCMNSYLYKSVHHEIL